MSPDFFDKIEEILHTERVDAYRQNGADEKLTLARYALNMALAESLYPALQFAEVGLRNAIHRAMTARLMTDSWYDTPGARLTQWQQDQVTDAKNAISIHHLAPQGMAAFVLANGSMSSNQSGEGDIRTVVASRKPVFFCMRNQTTNLEVAA